MNGKKISNLQYLKKKNYIVTKIKFIYYYQYEICMIKTFNILISLCKMQDIYNA